MSRKQIKSKLFYLNEAGELLLVRNRKSGLWTLPGGKKREKESPKQAMLRELEEELPHARFKDLRFQQTVTLRSGDAISLFEASGYSGRLKAGRASELDAEAFSKTPGLLPLTAGTKEILTRLCPELLKAA